MRGIDVRGINHVINYNMPTVTTVTIIAIDNENKLEYKSVSSGLRSSLTVLRDDTSILMATPAQRGQTKEKSQLQ